ncbi:NAD(P)/FAD-dependent oxidoreductase [Hyphomonas johnsonii]|uniref:Putative sulfide dehydrogenase, flavoprotein subunit n=1 Tax=Hyphomonas johnsonii MHS-2 TaxID=1280950 RepID=A0A059FU50_9PROT|nr:NAD(P)/FAD-dependent oxidoreductase [Hyphomonas johnsonii]KCZ94122.1 putative sulfide dehydrogenase, flavoprotein subunit [Hyphomonas johnsonii MHS-2]
MTERVSDTNRRHVLAGLGALAVPFVDFGTQAFAQTRARIVIVGGGFGGATAARSLRRLLPNADITLVEPNPTYTACPFSNLVVGGTRDISAQAFTYAPLVQTGITIIHDRAIEIDASRKEITLGGGASLTYDRLILSPGIDFRWGAIEGYDQSAAKRAPHAWKAGDQTVLLRDQLAAMEDGGLVVMSVPAPPFRCPPGPYERASLIANYLKTRKPRSKLLILDHQDRFSKMPLFKEAWAENYPDHLEWRGASDDGRVSRFDAASLTLSTDFDDIRADVANVIPPQKAGEIADRAGVADATGWCPINATSFESTLQNDIHVIGDATIAAPMPKSAFSANLQAKICAIAVARLVSDMAPEPTILANTCYSFVTPDQAVSISGVYSNALGQFSSIEGAGGLTPVGAMSNVRSAEAAQAEAWFAAITGEAFG